MCVSMEMDRNIILVENNFHHHKRVSIPRKKCFNLTNTINRNSEKIKYKARKIHFLKSFMYFDKVDDLLCHI